MEQNKRSEVGMGIHDRRNNATRGDCGFCVISLRDLTWMQPPAFARCRFRMALAARRMLVLSCAYVSRGTEIKNIGGKTALHGDLHGICLCVGCSGEVVEICSWPSRGSNR